jgi:hypothetical protein
LSFGKIVDFLLVVGDNENFLKGSSGIDGYEFWRDIFDKYSYE